MRTGVGHWSVWWASEEQKKKRSRSAGDSLTLADLAPLSGSIFSLVYVPFPPFYLPARAELRLWHTTTNAHGLGRVLVPPFDFYLSVFPSFRSFLQGPKRGRGVPVRDSDGACPGLRFAHASRAAPRRRVR